MENRYVPPEDLAGKLGSKKDLYDILNVDCKSSRFNPVYSRLLLTTLWEMFDRVYERNSSWKKVSLRILINHHQLDIANRSSFNDSNSKVQRVGNQANLDCERYWRPCILFSKLRRRLSP